MHFHHSTEAFISDVLAGGDVDLLINNVGASPSRNFLYMTDEDWTELHELNLMSAVRCTRAFLPAMRARISLILRSSATALPSNTLEDAASEASADSAMQEDQNV